MNYKQRDYLIKLVKHDLSHFDYLDLNIEKEEVENLLNELEYYKGGKLNEKV